MANETKMSVRQIICLAIGILAGIAVMRSVFGLGGVIGGAIGGGVGAVVGTLFYQVALKIRG